MLHSALYVSKSLLNISTQVACASDSNEMLQQQTSDWFSGGNSQASPQYQCCALSTFQATMSLLCCFCRV